MTYLPLFPLNLVVFPHEQLNLHIFEPRYKTLIRECVEEEKTFGIPAYIDGELKPIGTEMMVQKIVKEYPDGEMDISTLGLRIFEIKNLSNPAPGKPYAAAEVEFPVFEGLSEEVNPELFQLVEQFYMQLNKRFDYHVSIPQPYSFRVGHKIGLTLQEEYKMLNLKTEKMRQELLIDHLQKILPVMTQLEKTKERIAMNGHFKNLNPLNF